MIALTVSLQVVPGHRDDFLAAIEENAERSFTDEPGCRYSSSRGSPMTTACRTRSTVARSGVVAAPTSATSGATTYALAGHRVPWWYTLPVRNDTAVRRTAGSASASAARCAGTSAARPYA